MTTQERFRRSCRRSFAIIFGGLAVTFLGAIAGINGFGPPVPGVLFIGGLAITFVTATISYFVPFRCPHCRGNFASLYMNKLDRRPVQFCPFCGLDFADDAIDFD